MERVMSGDIIPGVGVASFSQQKLASRIRFALGELDMKPETLSKRAKINKGFLSELVNDKRKRTSLEAVVRISEALGTRIEWLIYGTGEVFVRAPTHPPAEHVQ